ncbi:hypothetical protein Ancab_023919 [Ancistrocladus abbreviatus]
MPDALRQSRYHVKKCFARYIQQGKRLLKLHQLMNELEQSIDDQAERAQLLEGTFGYILCSTQEAAVVPPHVAFAIRPSPGYWEYVKVNANDLAVESITAPEYLKYKESIFDEKWSKDENALEVDFGASDYSVPRLTLSSSIGNGMRFISKFLSSRIYGKEDAAKPLVEYLLSLQLHGEQLMMKGQIRWIAAQTDKHRNAELYRSIADTRGAFVQPAFYEAFGLTVIEAMNCGLPTFATNQGGPAEIIVDGISGFHIDPSNGDESSNKIADFFERCTDDVEYWDKLSAASLQRIYEW